jgi:phosphoesterase RecJ-like protein
MMMSSVELKAIISAISSSTHIVIVSHTNPDADAYGSACGLAWGLKALGKEVVVHNEDGFIPRYRAIPGASEVVKGGWRELSQGDLLFVVDCGGADRVGDSLIENLRRAPLVVNIDHHLSNTLFGTFNFVVDVASSTSELIFRLLKEIEAQESARGTPVSLIGSEAANALMAGIIGDTGSFRYSSTGADTFRVAAELVERGANTAAITQELFSTQSLVALRLQSEALSGIAVHENGFAEVVVTQEMIKRNGAEILDADSLAERGRDIEGVVVSALYKQDTDLWRVSLRSRNGAVDVSVIAQAFGGGGHKAAAAFRWRADLESLKLSLRKQVQEALNR